MVVAPECATSLRPEPATRHNHDTILAISHQQNLTTRLNLRGYTVQKIKNHHEWCVPKNLKRGNRRLMLGIILSPEETKEKLGNSYHKTDCGAVSELHCKPFTSV